MFDLWLFVILPIRNSQSQVGKLIHFQPNLTRGTSYSSGRPNLWYSILLIDSSRPIVHFILSTQTTKSQTSLSSNTSWMTRTKFSTQFLPFFCSNNLKIMFWPFTFETDSLNQSYSYLMFYQIIFIRSSGFGSSF